jgi:hypothetical protein
MVKGGGVGVAGSAVAVGWSGRGEGIPARVT